MKNQVYLHFTHPCCFHPTVTTAPSLQLSLSPFPQLPALCAAMFLWARPQLSSPVFFPNLPLKPCHKPSHTTLICAGDSKGMFVWCVLGVWSKVGPDPAVGYTVPWAR